MSERAAPFYCPYCGEEDLRPAQRSEKVPGAAWWCAGCLRTFVVSFVGIGVPSGPSSPTVPSGTEPS
ncbi:Insertion element protein [Pseudonocardia nematodicida]|uniref:Insertion element protein n=1 Tax=Pseudonocardia nematodicida TaxID=1206997 RepID=A0ABV1KJT9_9PSEU